MFGSDTANYLALITLSQFHFMFYVTRPLPNIFALAIGELKLVSNAYPNPKKSMACFLIKYSLQRPWLVVPQGTHVSPAVLSCSLVLY